MPAGRVKRDHRQEERHDLHQHLLLGVDLRCWPELRPWIWRCWYQAVTPMISDQHQVGEGVDEALVELPA